MYNLSPELLERVAMSAKANDQTVEEFVVRALEGHLSRQSVSVTTANANELAEKLKPLNLPFLFIDPKDGEADPMFYARLTTTLYKGGPRPWEAFVMGYVLGGAGGIMVRCMTRSGAQLTSADTLFGWIDALKGLGASIVHFDPDFTPKRLTELEPFAKRAVA